MDGCCGSGGTGGGCCLIVIKKQKRSHGNHWSLQLIIKKRAEKEKGREKERCMVGPGNC